MKEEFDALFAEHQKLLGELQAMRAVAKPEQEPVARSDAYDMIDRFLQNNLNSDADYAEYSKALDSIYTTPPQPKEPEQEPVAMKFKIYLPVKHQINHAKLPWVYDQDRSTGNVASMWVTPVATLPPQREWVGLTDIEWSDLYEAHHDKYNLPKQGSPDGMDYERAIEAKLKEKNHG